jgi:hypothetical protein
VSFQEKSAAAMTAALVVGYVLAVGVFAGLVLAMAEVDAFWIAHALLLAWVLAELTEGAVRIVRYRRGG